MLRSAALARCLCTRLLRAKGGLRFPAENSACDVSPVAVFAVCFARLKLWRCSRADVPRSPAQRNANALSERAVLADCKTLVSGHLPLWLGSELWPNRKRPARGLIPQEPTKPVCVVASFVSALWYSLRHRLYARHDTKQPEERPPRAVLGALRRAPPLESRRSTKAKRLPERRQKGCPSPRRRRVTR